jgi:hypothetical protein
MTIQETVKEKMKDAMRAKDSVRVTVLRGLMAAFTNELVTLGKTPQDTLEDEKALVVITRASKQRKDAIDQFTKGGREDLAEDEKAELVILEEFLPELMSDEEIEKVVLAKKAELGVTDKSQMGQLMGQIMAELKGKADGQKVKEAVEKSF